LSFWTDDLPVMFQDFGTTVTTSSSAKFTAIFDAEYVGVGELAEVESSGPVLTCQSTDVADLGHGETLTVDGVGYVIRAIQPDGTGVTLLRLERT
jgi:hypothetical protein